MDDLDLEPIRVGQAHPLAAARLVEGLDTGRAVDPRQLFEIVRARRMERDADIFRLAQFGDVDVVRRVAAAHIKRGRGALGPHHAESGQKLFLLVEIGGPQAPVGKIGGSDYRHVNLLCLLRTIIAQIGWAWSFLRRISG